MEYPYVYPAYPQMHPKIDYPDHGDGFGEYYGHGDHDGKSRSKHHTRKRDKKHSRSRSASQTRSRTTSRDRTRSLSRSRSRSRSRSQSRSRSHTRSRSRTPSGSKRDLNLKEPGFLDAFRVLYLTPSKHKKNETKYLATKKRQDRIQEILKSDGLGSKRWLFYPRSRNQIVSMTEPGPRENSDQRVKVDGEFFRKYKRSKKVDADAPIAKLKRWELLLYKKLGFIQAV